MKGYKGFDKGLVCRGKQYAENEIFEEETADLCNSGMHFCELPHQVFDYYSSGENHEFCEVEALGDIAGDNDKKCTTKLRIGAKVSVFDMAKISVSAFFERFNFDQKIKDAKKSEGAANAGYWGAANAGNCGAANAGYCGAANAGDRGAANAGDRGAANAGYCGAANAGDRGAANAGYRGAAIVRNEGKASVGKGGVAIALGKDACAKGDLGSLLVFTIYNDDNDIINHKCVVVDGEKIKPDTYYIIKDGTLVEAEG